MSIIRKIKEYFTSRPWTASAIVLIILGGLWYWNRGPADEGIKSFAVERGTVSQTVSVTGKVVPAQNVELSFEKGGRIAGVYRKIGDRISEGAMLVSLENGDIRAQLAQAEATVKAQTAKLEELRNGPRAEDLLVSEVDVSNSVNGVINDIKSGFVRADDAIRNKVDQFISNPKSSPQLNFTVSSSQLKSSIEGGRLDIESMLTAWSESITSLDAADDILFYAETAKKNLQLVGSYLDTVSLAVNALTGNASLSQTTVDAYKAAVLTGRTNVTTSIDSLASSIETLRTAESKFALKKAGTAKEQILAQEAEVEASEASVMNLRAQLSKTLIYSPISGVVTKQDAKAGEIAVAGSPLVSVISDSKYEIEANVPEADIAKIKIGDTAQVTLDAYGSDVIFEATVTGIDPAETVVDGVPTYKTTLQFQQNDPRIKSGMTANTDISGAKRENVLFIPGRAISGKGADKTVNLIDGETTREVKIETGLRGSNGDVEILSGLKEGDMVKAN